ncbi:hypothetical protein GQF03_17425 [Sneathiella chungangensis]|uniref:Uncharacterized protein n=1 Tax=Sneathiella chungangensis TaxID=1418234 RepID=A0A845MJK2_9PROT|nr:hypothetical protein [Sneathiella chungangensis]MZR24118.1 hypothetical protein [Sneathiella chungangensis]
MTAVHGNYGFDVKNKFVPFADPIKVTYKILGMTPETIVKSGDRLSEVCEAARHLLAVPCVSDEYFDDAWSIATESIMANWPQFPRENLPANDSPKQERREWVHNQISEILLAKELYERRLREVTAGEIS